MSSIASSIYQENSIVPEISQTHTFDTYHVLTAASVSWHDTVRTGSIRIRHVGDLGLSKICQNLYRA